MRWYVIAVLLGAAGIAATTMGQPPVAPKAGKVGMPRAREFQGGPNLRLPVGAAKADIRVEFQGQTVRVESSRDVSNVVLEYTDGSTQKFDGLSGRVGKLRGTGPHTGKEVIRAWVKSGPNFSGDGPGYGQRFERSPPSIERPLPNTDMIPTQTPGRRTR
jgi:hypothetical protein